MVTAADLPRIMGIVNVTPDSFSDGGRWATTEAAIAHGRHLLAQGADILDIGGESTRPGATRPLVSEELDRVIPVIEALSAEGAVLSVDTMRSEVAEASVRAGAAIINDVSGGLADPEILRVVAAHDVDYIAMHWRAHSTHMQDLAVYDGPGGVVAAVCEELAARIADAEAAGVRRDRVIVDPGLGFAKRGTHNWDLLRALPALDELGLPVLIGASRKSFLGALLADDQGSSRPVDGREAANTALTTLVALHGVWGVRVHDVGAASDALRVVAQLRSNPGGSADPGGAQ
ncbi:dihydropteroate synthase [Nocardioides daedukensis]|uniref:Dihydropteroate synthase n=1 Tax=Nocardioides daedukensis TaxID=634462 RepID=A0A7Y9UTR9_9ACTN|nr:dihydropteroate synthase [Nocardioides daedukensis]NYG58934.1 dihydropteroate synthase [Nocardioides daedukensis]